MSISCAVLGGSGFIGSHLCEALVRAGHSVRVLVPEGFSLRNLESIRDRVEILRFDMAAAARVDEIWGGIDVVFHLACTSRPKTSNDNPALDLEENLVSTVRILDRCVANNVWRVVFLSSGGTVYGNPVRVPIDENHPTAPLCSYGIHKLAIEYYLHLYDTLHALDYRVARVSNVYGERQAIHGNQGLIGTVLERIAMNHPVQIYGNGEAVRDYIHVADVVQALVLLAQVDTPSKIFNVGSGQGRTVMDIVRAVEAVLGKKAVLHNLPGRPLDVSRNELDTSRIRAETSWRPAVGLEDGIRRTVQWAPP
jgi:UDP-glucose 4-epimerase